MEWREVIAEIERIEEAICWQSGRMTYRVYRDRWPPDEAIDRLRELRLKLEREQIPDPPSGA